MSGGSLYQRDLMCWFWCEILPPPQEVTNAPLLSFSLWFNLHRVELTILYYIMKNHNNVSKYEQFAEGVCMLHIPFPVLLDFLLHLLHHGGIVFMGEYSDFWWEAVSSESVSRFSRLASLLLHVKCYYWTVIYQMSENYQHLLYGG
ncbi:hypothetical protein GOODEAATRI_009103 [Goodea atripinnis]|uniref:Maturase K n=1 Tax=Goodea atripinnis TaxID=208336 RepID=A0ABV0N958_9TELE